MFKIIDLVLFFQQVKYNFEPIDEIQSYLRIAKGFYPKFQRTGKIKKNKNKNKKKKK